MDKKKKWIILMLLSCFYIMVILYCAFQSINEYKKINSNAYYIYNKCMNSDEHGFQNKDCSSMLESIEDVNFYLVYDNMFNNFIGAIFAYNCIFINIFAVIWIYKMLKNKMVSNYYIRTNKKEFLKQLFKESYCYILPVLIAFIILFIVLFLNTKIYIPNNISWKVSTMDSPILFIIFILVNVVLFTASFINLGLIIMRKIQNYILTIMSVILFIFAYEISLSTFIGDILKIDYVYPYSLINYMIIHDDHGLFISLIFPIMLFIITFILVIIIYSNNEKLYLSCESKN